MSITSKIVLSLVLAGFAAPAFAQGSVAAPAHPTKPAVHRTLVHKVAAPVETSKTDTLSTAKPGVIKSEPMKPTVNTGIAKPMMPTATTTAPTTSPTTSPMVKN